MRHEVFFPHCLSISLRRPNGENVKLLIMFKFDHMGLSGQVIKVSFINSTVAFVGLYTCYVCIFRNIIYALYLAAYLYSQFYNGSIFHLYSTCRIFWHLNDPCAISYWAAIIYLRNTTHISKLFWRVIIPNYYLNSQICPVHTKTRSGEI